MNKPGLTGFCGGAGKAMLAAAAVFAARPIVAASTQPQSQPAATAPATPAAPPPYLRVVEEKGKAVELQIATRSYKPANGTGPTVALVGVAHIGDQAFYSNVQKLLESYDVVLYESVKPAGTGGAGGKTAKERVASTHEAMQFIGSVIETHHLKRGHYPADTKSLIEFAAAQDPRIARFVNVALIDAWGRSMSYQLKMDESGGRYQLLSMGADGKPGGEGEDADLDLADQAPPEPLLLSKDDGLQSQLASALGLKFQLEALDYARPNWRCSDMAIDEVNRRLEAKGLDFSLMGGTLAGSSLPAQLIKLVLGLMKFADTFLEGAIADTFKVVMIEMLGDPKLIDMSLDQLGKGFGEVIVNDRNQIPLDDLARIIEREPQVKSVAILYGAAHMDTMAAQLIKQLDYVPVEGPAGEQWLTVMRVDFTQSKVSPQELSKIRMMMKQMIREQTKRKGS
jgi:general secretion pathway protein G